MGRLESYLQAHIANMKTAIFVFGLLSVSLAAPVSEEKVEKPPAAIIKQINQVNDDGTYTFGFEADDGSFKVETRDKLGNVKGRYGFVDTDGVVRVLEYNAGNGTGFAAKSDYLPVPLVPVQLPQVLSSPEQRALDELYQSVDDDQDGIPDAPKTRVVVPLPAVPAVQAVRVVHTQPKEVVRTVAVPAAPAVHVVQHKELVHSVPVVQVAPVQKVAIPTAQVAFGAPAVHVVAHEPSQKALDAQFQSVDDDEDGIPDTPALKAAVPAFQTFPVHAQPVFKAAGPVAVPVVHGLPQQVVRHPGVPDFEQLVRDLQFQSVDADEDGIPDQPVVFPVHQAGVAHVDGRFVTLQHVPLVHNGRLVQSKA